MAKWQFTKGLHDLGVGCLAYLQPDGGWGWSNETSLRAITDGLNELGIPTARGGNWSSPQVMRMLNCPFEVSASA